MREDRKNDELIEHLWIVEKEKKTAPNNAIVAE